ncbi:MAG: hypothetical protein ABIF84_00675 [Patescibacteria group bacterium]
MDILLATIGLLGFFLIMGGVGGIETESAGLFEGIMICSVGLVLFGGAIMVFNKRRNGKRVRRIP